MKISSSFSLFRASCRIRTNDPEITNHVLWPTELKRRGWVSLLYRAATTNYLCCDQALADSQGAGRIGLTRFAAVSYTHLDVYKRQEVMMIGCASVSLMMPMPAFPLNLSSSPSNLVRK